MTKWWYLGMWLMDFCERIRFGNPIKFYYEVSKKKNWFGNQVLVYGDLKVDRAFKFPKIPYTRVVRFWTIFKKFWWWCQEAIQWPLRSLYPTDFDQNLDIWEAAGLPNPQSWTTVFRMLTISGLVIIFRPTSQ